MTSAFYGLRHATLVFQTCTGQPTRQNLALFVDKFEQKVCVFVVNVFDAAFLKAAVFFFVLRVSDNRFVNECHGYQASVSVSALTGSDFLLNAPLRRFSLYSNAYLSNFTVRKRITRSSRLNSVSNVLITSG